jgi:pimeloyl-ACP methyl ester carboxylesterase
MRSVERYKIRFDSGDADCRAWHYPGGNGGCVVMAGGFAVTKEPGTDLFAQRFQEAGFSVLAFDYRRLGESGGQPRQVLRVRDQLADWRAALAFAATLPDVDPDRLAAWGFSVSGGHVLRVAADHPRLAAVIAQTPNADGPAALRNAARFQTPGALLRLTARGLLDALGGLVGAAPRLVPLVGDPGTVAILATPDARADTERALNPGNRYPDWQQAAAARSVLPLGGYRPGRHADRVACPLLVVVCDQDQSALAEPAVRVAERAPRGELVRIPGGHYQPFLEGHERVVEAEVEFLRRTVLLPTALGRSTPDGPAPDSPLTRSAEPAGS